MRNTKIEISEKSEDFRSPSDLNSKQILNSKLKIKNCSEHLNFGTWNLFRISILGFSILILCVGPAMAMASKPPAQEESKYKLEILKMEVVPATQVEVKSPKKILMVIAPKNFHDREFSIPKNLFEKKGYQVTVASSTLSETTGMLGMKAKPDILVKDAKATDYDAIVFVGGSGTPVYFNNPQVLSLAIEAAKHDKTIGAICIAPVILTKAGILQGKKATVWGGEKSSLTKGGAIYTGKDVEVDDKIITANGPSAAEKFAQKIIEQLESTQP